MRVADYIAEFIAETLKCDKVFLVTGGGMMFLSDGVACSDKLSAVCTHHEQAAAMAAVGYAKYTGNFGCGMFTTGCGGTNAITGLLNAYQDGAKAFFISGQVKRKQTTRNSGLPLRQFGVQEADIVSIVGPITKYAAMVNEPQDIAYHLEKAKYLAQSGHPGPVWIDVPMDVQGAIIDKNNLRHFEPDKTEERDDLSEAVAWLEARLAKAARPVVLVGQGVDLSGTKSEFYDFIRKHKIPVVTSFLGGNSISPYHPNYIGRVGTKGNRSGNLALQNADLLLVLGCRLSVSTTGHEFDTFAREAEVMVVDVDRTVYDKNTVKIDFFCHADLRDFFVAVENIKACGNGQWLKKSATWKAKYPACFSGCENDAGGISFYGFLDKLSSVLSGSPGSAVVSDAGSSFYASTQAVRFD